MWEGLETHWEVGCAGSGQATPGSSCTGQLVLVACLYARLVTGHWGEERCLSRLHRGMGDLSGWPDEASGCFQ